jgi:CBS domain-containing protein
MNLQKLTAAELMSPDVLTIEASEPLRAAAQRMSETRVHCLIVPPTEPGACVGIVTVPVLDGVRLVGVLSFTDVLRAAARESPAT